MGSGLSGRCAGWVVSYNLSLAAREQRVVRWQISCDVPLGTRVNPNQTQWYRRQFRGSAAYESIFGSSQS